MTNETVTQEVYKTKDGKIFLNEKEAIKHEKVLANTEALEKFVVSDMPQELPDDFPTLMPKRYTWYYVRNEKEFDELTGRKRAVGWKIWHHYAAHKILEFIGCDAGLYLPLRYDRQYRNLKGSEGERRKTGEDLDRVLF